MEGKKEKTYEYIEFLNSILRSIKSVNQFIVMEKNPEKLIKRSCELLIETHGFLTVWMQLVDEKGENIFSSEVGIGDLFKKLEKNLKDQKNINCIEKLRKSGNLVKIETPAKECSNCPLSGTYSGSVAYSVYIKYKNRLFGSITVSLKKEFINYPEVENLIREVSRDIGFALHDIEIENIAEIEREKTQNYLDSAGVIIILLDNTGRITLINKKGVEILGYDNESELIGKNWFENFISVSEREKVFSVFNKILKVELNEVESFTNQIIRKDGSLRLIEWFNSYIKNRKGIIINTLSSGIDITEKSELKFALEQSEKKYRMLFENSAIGIGLSDSEGNIIDTNNKMCSIMGYKKEELSIVKLKDTYVNPEERNNILKKIRTDGKIRNYEVQMKKRNGEIYWASLSISNVNISGKDLFLTEVVDVSKKKRAEEELLKYQEDLEKLVEKRTKKIKKINQELAERNSDLEKFFKATLERENRIKELRDKVAELEAELKKKS